MQKHDWLMPEKEYVIANYQQMPTTEISKALFEISGVHRSRKSINAIAVRLGVSKRRIWSEEETNQLLELSGEYSQADLVNRFNRWARDKGLRSRSPGQIRSKLRHQKEAVRLNASSKYLTNVDIKLLLGCNRTTVSNLLKQHKKELNPQKDGGKTYVSRAKLRTFLVNHQDILERYQSKLDIRWLVDILRSV